MISITKLAVAGVVALSSFAASAASPTTSFTINQTFSQGTGLLDIGNTVSLGGAGDFLVDPGSSADYFDFSFGAPGTTGTFSTAPGANIEGYYFLREALNNKCIQPAHFPPAA
jgi:hypothetical protein